MSNTFSQQFLQYLAQHRLEFFDYASYGGIAFFEAEQLNDLPGSEIIQTQIIVSATTVTIEWQLICEPLLPESRWAMLEFLNVLNQEATAFSTVLSLADNDDEFSTLTFRYYEILTPMTTPEQTLLNYEFMARYVNDVLYPEVLAIAQTHE